MEASAEYEPIFKKIHEKIKLSKIVIEFLLDKAWENPNYEDLVQQVESTGEYPEVVDTILQNAQFICDQVRKIFIPIQYIVNKIKLFSGCKFWSRYNWRWETIDISSLHEVSSENGRGDIPKA